jgi:membrane protein implicated in regulation of membrane protease activity
MYNQWRFIVFSIIVLIFLQLYDNVISASIKGGIAMGLFDLFTLLNLALVILGVVYLVYGIMAFRKYLKSDTLPSQTNKPEEG